MNVVRLTVCFLLLGLFAPPAQAGYSSLYIFGDGICGTTNGPGGSFYYGKRLCNGRVWPEVLAQWQGITYESNKNWSYYGHYSTNMVPHVASISPPDASTALFVIWACDADFVGNINYGTNITQWTNSINISLSNHFTMITNLYAKGARTLVMPNAVDLAKVPRFINNSPANKAFIRQQTIDFNTRFASTISNATATLPGLVIHSPNIFALLDNVVANPTNYGLIKPHTFVIEDLVDWSLNGPGTNYVFWDDLNPTAMFQMWIADAAQQLISPVRINKIKPAVPGKEIEASNIPIGRDGIVEGCPNFAGWNFAQAFESTNSTQTIPVSSSGPMQFYRLRFPFAWTWP